MAEQPAPGLGWESSLDECRRALRAGRLVEGEQLATETHQLAREQGEWGVASDAAILLAKLKSNLQQSAATRHWAEQALDDARKVQDAGREAVAWVLISGACAEARRPLDALRAAQRAAALTEQVREPGQLQSLQTGLMITYNALGLVQLALTSARRALRVALVHAPATDRVLLRWNLLVTGLKLLTPAPQLEPENAQGLLAELAVEARLAMADPELHESPALGAGCCSVAGQVLALAGHPQEALPCLERGVGPGFEEPDDEMMHRWHQLARLQHQLALPEHEASMARAKQLAQAVLGQATVEDLPTRAEAAQLMGDWAQALEATQAHNAHVVRMLQAAFELRTAELVVDLARKSGEVELAHLRLHNLRLSEDVAQLSRVARSDALTGLLNRGGLEEAWSQVQAQLESFAVLLIDLDHFKRVNDEHSHIVGDAVLRRLGHELADELRSPDVVGRYGGEEFLAMITGVDLIAAQAVAERLRRRVAQAQWQDLAPGIQVSISGGLVMAGRAESFSDGVARADHLLYEAKRGGRNRIAVQAH